MSATKLKKAKSSKATKAAQPAAPVKLARVKPAPVAEKKLSALDAAAKVLGEARTAMTCPEMIEAMRTKGYWSSPKGLTPAATLSAAILREVKLKGVASRFARTERGKFALNT